MQFTPEQEEFLSIGRFKNSQPNLSPEQIEKLNYLLKQSYAVRGLLQVSPHRGVVGASFFRGASRVANLGSSAVNAVRGQLNSAASKTPFGSFLTKQRSLPKFLGGKPAPSIVQQADDAAVGAAGQVDDVAQRAAGQVDDVAQTSIPRSNPVQRMDAIPKTQPLSTATQTPAAPNTAGGAADDAAQAAARPVNAQPPTTTTPVAAQPPTAPTALPVKDSPAYVQMRENLKAQRNALPKNSPERKALDKQIKDLDANAPKPAQNPTQATQTPAAPNAAGAADDAAQTAARPVNAQPPTPGVGGMTADETAAFRNGVGDDTYNLFFGNTLRAGATVQTKLKLPLVAEMKVAPNWLKNLWTGRGITDASRGKDVRAVQKLFDEEAKAIAATRGGVGTAPTVDDRINAAKAIELSVKNDRIRPVDLLEQYNATGRSLATNAVSPASSQGRTALAAQQAADDVAKAIPEKEAGGSLMQWANKNPIPAAVLGGAGILALPRLVNGSGQPSTIIT